MNELTLIQNALKAPKSQYNTFGKYNYRNCEDILEALKPHLKETETAINISDEIIFIGDRYYVKATAKLLNKDGVVAEASAFAREAETQKGMNEAQLTGSASSYARKYALNGLLAIDDTKDPDTTNKHGKDNKERPPKKKTVGDIVKEKISEGQAIAINELLLESGSDEVRFMEHFQVSKINDIPLSKYNQAITMLKAKLDRAKKSE